MPSFEFLVINFAACVPLTEFDECSIGTPHLVRPITGLRTGGSTVVSEGRKQERGKADEQHKPEEPPTAEHAPTAGHPPATVHAPTATGHTTVEASSARIRRRTAGCDSEDGESDTERFASDSSKYTL